MSQKVYTLVTIPPEQRQSGRTYVLPRRLSKNLIVGADAHIGPNANVMDSPKCG